MLKRCAMSVAFLFLLVLLVLNATRSETRAQQSEQTQLRQPQFSTTAKSDVAAESGSSIPSNAAPALQPFALPRGTTLLAELSGSLKAKKLKPGDKVKAVLVQDVVAGGKLIVKTDSKLVGHVTEVKVRDAQDTQSRLGIVFDKILLKRHQELQIEAVVQALAPPVLRRSRVDEPDQMMPPLMLSPVNNMGSMAAGRGTGSASVTGPSTGTTVTLASSVGDVGTITTVQSTPGNGVSSVTPAVARNQPISGGAGVHGVYGLKHLGLTPSTTHATSGPVIVSAKSDVKLDNGTQLVLSVISK